MIELLAMVAIMAVVVALVIPWVGNYTNWAQTTTTQHTVAVLNEALNEYRSLGGINKSHSLEGAAGITLNEQTLTDNVISALATGFTCGNERKTFLSRREHIDTTAIGSTGQGLRFRFVAILNPTSPTEPEESHDTPEITVQPSDITASTGLSYTLKVSANHATSYQWFHSSDGSSYSVISGATSTDLDFNNIQSSDAGYYYVNIINNYGQVTSRTAKITVLEGSVTKLASGISGAYGIIEGNDNNLYVTAYDGDALYRVTKAGSSTAIATGMDGAYGIIEDTDGDFYITAEYADKIYRVSKSGTKSILTSSINGPWGIIKSSDGAFYVTAYDNSSVHKVTQSGITTTLATGISGAYSVIEGTQNDLYVTAYNSDSIYRVTKDGSKAVFVSGTSYPRDIIKGSDGYFYVVAFGDNSIYRIASNGTKAILASGINGPRTIIEGNSGDFYVTAYSGNAVYLIQKDGTRKSIATIPGPRGVIVGSDGYLYVTSYSGNAVYVIR